MGAPISIVAESESFVIESGSVDRERGIIRNVRVCGPRSKNGRKYPLAVLEKHVQMYAAPSYIGHHFHPLTKLPVDPPLLDKFGRILNPRIHSGGIVGDYKYNPEHAFAKPFLWAAENDPSQYCLSPLKKVRWAADPYGRPKLDADGDQVAESVLVVSSVDVVDAGGTTDSIFESWVKESSMDMPNATDIAGQLETDGAWVAFLTDLFAQMKGLQQSTKDTITALVTSALANSTDSAVPPDGAEGAAVAPAMESLRRCGPVGRWAAKRLDAVYVAEAATKRQKWAADLIKAELVPEALVTDVFVETVAESYGNESRAKALCTDRKALSAGKDKKGPTTTDRTGGPSVADLVNGWVAG